MRLIKVEEPFEWMQSDKRHLHIVYQLRKDHQYDSHTLTDTDTDTDTDTLTLPSIASDISETFAVQNWSC